MPKFKVLVTREVTESATITVEAVSGTAAKNLVYAFTPEEIENYAKDGEAWERDETPTKWDFSITAVNEA